jgi:hypothetical protein
MIIRELTRNREAIPYVMVDFITVDRPMNNFQPVSREAQALSFLNAFTRPSRLPDNFLERWCERVLVVVAYGFVSALLVDVATGGL